VLKNSPSGSCHISFVRRTSSGSSAAGPTIDSSTRLIVARGPPCTFTRTARRSPLMSIVLSK
jgi:hypothetical protein